MKERVESILESPIWRQTMRPELTWLQEKLDDAISANALPSVVNWGPSIPESVQAAIPMLGFVEHHLQIEFLESCNKRISGLADAIRVEEDLAARQATRSVRKRQLEVTEAGNPDFEIPPDFGRARHALNMVARRLHQSTSREEAHLGSMLCASFKQLRRQHRNKLKLMVSRSTPTEEGCLVDDLDVAWRGLLAVDTSTGEYWANKAVLDAGLLCARILLQETGAHLCACDDIV